MAKYRIDTPIEDRIAIVDDTQGDGWFYVQATGTTAYNLYEVWSRVKPGRFDVGMPPEFHWKPHHDPDFTEQPPFASSGSVEGMSWDVTSVAIHKLGVVNTLMVWEDSLDDISYHRAKRWFVPSLASFDVGVYYDNEDGKSYCDSFRTPGGNDDIIYVPVENYQYAGGVSTWETTTNIDNACNGNTGYFNLKVQHRVNIDASTDEWSEWKVIFEPSAGDAVETSFKPLHPNDANETDFMLDMDPVTIDCCDDSSNQKDVTFTIHQPAQGS